MAECTPRLRTHTLPKTHALKGEKKKKNCSGKVHAIQSTEIKTEAEDFGCDTRMSHGHQQSCKLSQPSTSLWQAWPCLCEDDATKLLFQPPKGPRARLGMSWFVFLLLLKVPLLYFCTSSVWVNDAQAPLSRGRWSETG